MDELSALTVWWRQHPSSRFGIVGLIVFSYCFVLRNCIFLTALISGCSFKREKFEEIYGNIAGHEEN